MNLQRYVHSTVAEAATHCGARILEVLEDRLSAAPKATLAISGGATPRPMFEYMAAAGFDWSRVHIFWVDERSVPPSDAQSNYRLAHETLLAPARIPDSNVHRIRAELQPDEAAWRYQDELRSFFQLAPGDMPHLDAIHRGIGPEGHTASLFPGEPLIEDRQRLAAAVWVEKLATWRITMLPGVLLAARHTMMLVCGGDKAAVVERIFKGPFEPMKIPAQALAQAPDTSWFFDKAAAVLIEE